ncbi:MAG: PAS domain S-box protein [Candidatus Scalindua sediminis]|nr:PAS domain S-box protein [Candidatus Scalindua sediminis]
MNLENIIEICKETIIKFIGSIRGKLIGYFLLMTMIPLLTVSIISYYNGKKAVEQRVIEQLTSIADLKKIELQNWLQERLLDTKIISRNKFLEAAFTSLFYIRRLTDSVDSMLKSNVGREYHIRLLMYINKLKSTYKVFNEIYIIDIESGEILVSTNEDNVGKKEPDLLFFKDVLKMMRLPIKDIHYSNRMNQICMSFFGPIHKTDPVSLVGSNIMIGALILRANIDESIEPIIQNWPGMGKTGETLLVRREGENVVFLNNLRHRKDSALKFKIPVTAKNARSSIMSSEGKEGIIKTTDYRNVPVLSAYRYIPMLKWGLVAKQDSNEAFAPINKLKSQVIVLVIISTAGVIVAVFLIASSITSPIKRLVQGAKSIAGGDLTQRITINTKDEIGILANEFNKMTARLEESYSSLEQKINERTAELKESEEKYRESVNSANDAIFTLDINTAQIIDSNKKAETLSGYSKAELCNLKIWDIYSVQDKPRLEKLWKQVKEVGSGTLHDVNYKKKDRSITPTSLSVSVIEYGNRKFIQNICRDITERKKLEEQLVRSERLAAIGELAAEVAHEINNPLGGLQNFVKMVAREPANVQQTKEFIELIQEGLNRIEVIVKRLTTFSKPYVLRMSDHDLNDIVKESLIFMEHRIEDENISLQKRFAPNLPKVYVDVDNVSQVIINLLANAFDSMPNGGKLLIESKLCKDHDSCVQFLISDTGYGIKKDEVDKIFDPFFSTKGNSKGIGLGLAISKRIMEDHGGNIRVASSSGKGTTFAVCFPTGNDTN